MNLQPMHPRPEQSRPFRVFCVACSTAVDAQNVLCDLDGPPGSFYCPSCANKIDEDKA